MNKSKIEWTDYSWNPITGCLHTCPYCYARKQSVRFSGDIRLNMADDRCKGDKDKKIFVLEEPFITRDGKSISYPFGFVPTLHTYRLDWPQKVKSGANVFVGSMTDLFGEWVPDAWIEQVFNACDLAPQHNYMFLTKNPKRYIALAEKGILRATDNFWYGSSIPTPDTEYFYHDQLKTFVSIEPLLAPFDYEPTDELVRKVDWVIIGAETGNRKGKVVPKSEWVQNIVDKCFVADIPVFMKDSLIPIIGEENMRRDFPKELQRKELSPKLKSKLYSHCGICKKTLKKAEMTALLAREKRGAGAKAIGYACNDCFEKLAESLGDSDES